MSYKYKSPLAKKAWNYIQTDIKKSDPQVANKYKPFLSRLYHALNKTLQSIDTKISNGTIDPYAKLNSIKYSPDPDQQKLHHLDRPIKPGFLPLAGNPLWWGHLLIILMAIDNQDLDTGVIRVQGEILYKDMPETDRVPVKDRHHIIKKLIHDNFYPLLRYTDLGTEPGNQVEGSVEMHNFLAINKNIKTHLYYLLGIENVDRVHRYFDQQYRAAKDINFYINPNHTFTMAWIQRGDYGQKATHADLEKISQIYKKKYKCPWSIDFALVKDKHIDLNVSSTYYRNTHDPAILPTAIDRHAKDHGFYGHPPIDPRTGKPYNYSEEEHFKHKLRNVTEGIANQIVRFKERLGDDHTIIIAIDGPSGSGKTTIAQEVLKYLDLRQHNGIHLSLDIFLKEKKWRTAIEKKIVGNIITSSDKKLLGPLFSTIKTKKKFTKEADVFWDTQKVLDMYQKLFDFSQSNQKNLHLHYPDGYNRQEHKRQDYDYTINKGDIVIIDGKYAHQANLVKLCHLHYRLLDNPDRTKAKFEIRTRSLSPNTADIQMVSYDLCLVPSFQVYAKQTKKYIDYIIDLKTDDWKLTSLKD